MEVKVELDAYLQLGRVIVVLGTAVCGPVTGALGCWRGFRGGKRQGEALVVLALH
jgi:hypothetical protein